MGKKPDPPAKHPEHTHYVALRGAILELRTFARRLESMPRKAMGAVELYDRLTKALYPRDEDARREPLDRLLDAARADEVHDHNLELEKIRDGLKRLAIKAPPAIAEEIREIAAGIADFFDAGKNDEKEPPDFEEAEP